MEKISNSTKKESNEDELIKFYKESVDIDKWLNNNVKYQIIKFKNKTEYKVNNKYHRINGPAIEFKNDKNDENNKYYYKGVLYEDKKEWTMVTKKEIRKLKLKKIKNKKNSD